MCSEKSHFNSGSWRPNSSSPGGPLPSSATAQANEIIPRHSEATARDQPTPALQPLSSSTYSAPYVAVDSYTDPTSDSSGRLLASGTRGAYAASAQRGPGSGFRVGYDRKHIRSSDFFSIDESHCLSGGDLFRRDLDTYFFDREAKHGATGGCSGK